MTLEKEKGSLEISESQKLGKGINTYHIHHWEFNLPQHVEMMVFRHDITSAGGDSTINEFIVILIRSDQMKAKMRIELPRIPTHENRVNKLP